MLVPLSIRRALKRLRVVVLSDMVYHLLSVVMYVIMVDFINVVVNREDVIFDINR